MPSFHYLCNKKRLLTQQLEKLIELGKITNTKKGFFFFFIKLGPSKMFVLMSFLLMELFLQLQKTGAELS